MGQTLAELRLANDLGTLGLVRAYTRELAALADLPIEDSAALVWAVEAACTDIIEHAFDPGEITKLALYAELTPAALTIAVHERGLPFDPGRVDADGEPPADDAVATAARAPLWRQIRLAVDQAQWINAGPDGMVLRLTKARPARSSVLGATTEAPAAPRPELPLAPPQQYTIRRLDPSDAIQVSQVIYRVYGYSYPNPDLYYADHIVHLNETGELVSVVAVDESGTVVGHYALERPGLGPVAEAGQAVVAPAHRGRKLMEQMHAYLESEGRRLGLAGIYVQPVTAHTFSQRVQEDFGIRPCGVSLGVWPALVFKQIAEEAQPERSTLMLYYKYMQPPAPSVVHVPAHHRAMVERIYANLGGPVEFQVGRAPRGYGKVSVSYLKTHRLATIHVQQIGVDTAAEVRRVREDLVELAAVDAVLLELPLAQ